MGTEHMILPDAADQEFENLFKEHYPALVAFMGRRGCGPEESRDLAQEALLRAYQKLHTLTDRSALRSWLLSIVVNLWRNELRARQSLKRKAAEVSLEGSREDGVQVSKGLWADSGPRDPEQRAIDRQQREQMQRVMGQLSGQQSRCLLLWLGGHSYLDIAQTLGISESSVKVTLHRAKKKVEALLHAEDGGRRP